MFFALISAPLSSPLLEVSGDNEGNMFPAGTTHLRFDPHDKKLHALSARSVFLCRGALMNMCRVVSEGCRRSLKALPLWRTFIPVWGSVNPNLLWMHSNLELPYTYPRTHNVHIYAFLVSLRWEHN